MDTKCPLIQENEELKAEVTRLKEKLQETIDEIRRKLTDESPDTG
jgi:cell division protein FtsB